MTPDDRLWITEAREHTMSVAAMANRTMSEVESLVAQLSSMRHRLDMLSAVVAQVGTRAGVDPQHLVVHLPELANGDFISTAHTNFDYDRILASVASWNIGQERIPRYGRYDEWFKLHGRAVSIVIPSFNDYEVLSRCLDSLKRVRQSYNSVRVIVTDDASTDPKHLAFLKEIEDEGIIVNHNIRNVGFAQNVNNALSRVNGEDVLLLNSDVEAEGFWLEALQYAAYASGSGIVGAKLLYPNRTIQHAGVHRNPKALECFNHYYKGQNEFFGPACVPSYQLAVTGACFYITNQVFKKVGMLDPAFPMAFEDVDYCLRAWRAEERVLYYPYARLIHHESITRGHVQGKREIASQSYFWGKWQTHFDRPSRKVRRDQRSPQIIYVLEDTGIAGGHRNIFDHVNLLIESGYETEVWSLAKHPDWFDLKTPVRTFPDFPALVTALTPLECVKVATWWNTAESVWIASLQHGYPAYLVSDIEASYYVDDPYMQAKVLASYKFDFKFFTICEWNIRQLVKLGIDASLVSCSVDNTIFRPIGLSKRSDVLMAPGRRNHLKNFQFTLKGWAALGDERPVLWMYGGEPDIADFMDKTRYFYKPSDTYLNRIINEAAAFVLTSRHEGFALTILEAMSAGTPVITTDCHGNQDFCINGENCLVIREGDYAGLTAAIRRIMTDTVLRERLIAGGLVTAERFSRDSMREQLLDFFSKFPVRRRRGSKTGTSKRLKVFDERSNPTGTMRQSAKFAAGL